MTSRRPSGQCRRRADVEDHPIMRSTDCMRTSPTTRGTRWGTVGSRGAGALRQAHGTLAQSRGFRRPHRVHRRAAPGRCVRPGAAGVARPSTRPFPDALCAAVDGHWRRGIRCRHGDRDRGVLFSRAVGRPLRARGLPGCGADPGGRGHGRPCVVLAETGTPRRLTRRPGRRSAWFALTPKTGESDLVYSPHPQTCVPHGSPEDG